MAEVPDTVDDAIAELSATPTTDEVFFKTLPFQGREIASAAVSMAAGGGGPGGSEGGVYGLEALAVASAASTPYLWTFLYGTPQLDVSDTDHPAVLTAGVYALTVMAFCPAVFTAGKKMIVGIDIDTENNDAGVSFGGLMSAIGASSIPFSGGVTFYSPDGNSMLANVTHDDNVTGNIDFSGKAYVQKIV